MKPDTLVGLCLERGVDLIAALFGIHKAAGGYVPLDPHYPADRLNYMIKDAGLRFLVTTSDNSLSFDGEVLHLDKPETWQNQTASNPEKPHLADRYGLRHLYLRLHRQAQGGGGRTPQRRQLLFQDRLQFTFGMKMSDHVPLLRLRLLGLGDFRRPALRRPPRFRRSGYSKDPEVFWNCWRRNRSRSSIRCRPTSPS